MIMNLFKPGLFLILVLSLLFGTCAQGNTTRASRTENPKDTTKPCTSGGQVAVIFTDMSVSKFLVWPAAILLITGTLQILIGLFVFMSEALDIYMLLLNYCVATLFCIFTILFTGSGLFTITQKTCVYLSPLSCIAISVPMMSLFLLSYSRFYAISHPFYYADFFTFKKQIVFCLLSWIIPIAVVGVGSATLCTSISLHYDEVFTGICLYPFKPIHMYSYKQYEEGKHYQEWENFFTPFPSSINCQVYMYLYVLTCLILPLLGCIICYICIIQQIAVIKKDRENLTNTSSSTARNPNNVAINDEDGLNKSFRVKSLAQHLKRQTCVISRKAKEIIPVSVIVILSLYVLVAVPLTLVEIFNTNLVEAKETMVWINLDRDNLAKLSSKDEFRWCGNSKPTTSTPKKDIKALMLDIAYSVGIIALGLSPWAYIKFTKSFEENLWLNPLRKVSSRISLEIRKSVNMKPTPNLPNSQRYVSKRNGNAGYTSSATPFTSSSKITSNIPAVNQGTGTKINISAVKQDTCTKISMSAVNQGTGTNISMTAVSNSPICSAASRNTGPEKNATSAHPNGKPADPVEPTKVLTGKSRRRVRGRPHPTSTESSNQVGKDNQDGITTQSDTDKSNLGEITTQSETDKSNQGEITTHSKTDKDNHGGINDTK